MQVFLEIQGHSLPYLVILGCILLKNNARFQDCKIFYKIVNDIVDVDPLPFKTYLKPIYAQQDSPSKKIHPTLQLN